MSGATSLDEAACLEAAAAAGGVEPDRSHRRLQVEHQPVTAIRPERWDALARANPWATPFSASPFQRAWWDAYRENAVDATLVVRDPAAAGDEGIVGILPLMRRRSTDPDDDPTHTQLRHGHQPELTPLPEEASVLFMGASYHADYATLLAAPEDVASACEAIASHLSSSRREPDAAPAQPPARVAGSGQEPPPWDAVDLRRLRCADPVADQLAAAFGAREMDQGWTLNLEWEDVCPVTTIPEGADFDGFLATLRGKDRHEIRRKIRRAEAVGEIRFEIASNPLAELDSFVQLHQARWGDQGLFAPTPGGAQSRQFLRRLFELSGQGGDVRLTFLSVGGRRIASGVHFETPDSILYYNTGLDPSALDLSPGILLIAAYVRLAIETGRRRIDFLRGDEPYKYQWAAVDEPVRRLLVRRTEQPR